MAGGVPLWEDRYEPDRNAKVYTPEELEQSQREYAERREVRYQEWAEQQREAGSDDSRSMFADHEYAEMRRYGVTDD
jgi:hypothetical protein